MFFCWAPLRKNLAPSLLHSHRVYILHIYRIPLSLFSRLSVSSLSLSSNDRCSNHLIIIMASHWTHSSMSMSLLHWGAQNWTQHSKCVSPVLNKREVSPLDLLAVLCLMQPRMLLSFFATRVYCWLPLNFLSTRTMCPFLRSCFPDEQASACTGVQAYSSPDAGLCLFPHWTSWHSCWPISPVCQGRSEWQHSHLVYQTLLPILYHPQTCWGSILPHHPGH